MFLTLMTLKKRTYNKDWLDKYFVLGNIVDIELGYIETIPVYKGYISMVSADFSESEFPKLTIECMDVKGLMMQDIKSEKKGL